MDPKATSVTPKMTNMESSSRLARYCRMRFYPKFGEQGRTVSPPLPEAVTYWSNQTYMMVSNLVFAMCTKPFTKGL